MPSERILGTVDQSVLCALFTPCLFDLEVRGGSHCEKAVGPFHKKGFSAASEVEVYQASEVEVYHPSSSEATGDVGDDVLRDPNAESGAIVSDMDLGQSLVHLVLEVLQIRLGTLGQSLHSVCDAGSSEAVLTRSGSLDAHFDSSSQLLDCWKAGI